MLQNHTWVNDPCKVQDRPMDSNVTVKQLTDMVSDFILQISLRNCHMSNFGMDSKKNIHNYLPFPTT